jgi:hypothetical protein
MPLLQYFGWAGSLLLAAILVANAYLPAPAAPQLETPLDRKISIRIHTDHKWPERVVFDTTIARETGTGTGVGTGELAVKRQRQPPDTLAAVSAFRGKPCFRSPCSALSSRSAAARAGKPLDFPFAGGQG